MSVEGEDLPQPEREAVDRAFGVGNRRRILAEYFSAVEDELTTATAWLHVYRLLLWINPTISLAHCYESDKCQPHKAWYPRSLAFHAWIGERLGVDPGDVHAEIDHLFKAALPDLARVETEARRLAAARHLVPYDGRGMPRPGDDADLIEIIEKALSAAGKAMPLTGDLGRTLVEQIYAHFAQENKRKNLLGRGFEDTLMALIQRLPGHERWDVGTRVALADIPGFTPHSVQLQRTEIDLALWEKGGSPGRRILVSAKWSVRADRERQFDSDFDDYSKANSAGLFEYSLITNEFDAARLGAACSKVRGNQYLFHDVVHVEPDGVLVAYGGGTGRGRAEQALPAHLATNRLISLERWLAKTLMV